MQLVDGSWEPWHCEGIDTNLLGRRVRLTHWLYACTLNSSRYQRRCLSNTGNVACNTQSWCFSIRPCTIAWIQSLVVLGKVCYLGCSVPFGHSECKPSRPACACLSCCVCWYAEEPQSALVQVTQVLAGLLFQTCVACSSSDWGFPEYRIHNHSRRRDADLLAYSKQKKQG